MAESKKEEKSKVYPMPEESPSIQINLNQAERDAIIRILGAIDELRKKAADYSIAIADSRGIKASQYEWSVDQQFTTLRGELKKENG